MSLVPQRCFTHPGREAVARCPECGHGFCRECVTEHQGRVLCRACLEALTGETQGHRRGLGRALLELGLAGIGLVTLFLAFKLLGSWLAKTPAIFEQLP
ncbi:MAG: rhomboid family protein [Opitutales bacterium]